MLDLQKDESHHEMDWTQTQETVQYDQDMILDNGNKAANEMETHLKTSTENDQDKDEYMIETYQTHEYYQAKVQQLLQKILQTDESFVCLTFYFN